MKVSLSLLAVLAASAHAADQVHYDSNLGAACRTVTPPDTIAPDTVLSNFATGNGIRAGLEPFKTTAPSKQVIQRLTTNGNVTTFVRFVTGSKGAMADDTRMRSHNDLKSWAAKLQPDHVKSCGTGPCMELLFGARYNHLWKNMSAAAKRAINGDQLDQIFGACATDANLKEALDKLPPEFLTEHAVDLVDRLGSRLDKMSATVISHLLKVPHTALVIDSAALTTLIKNGKTGLLTAEFVQRAAEKFGALTLDAKDKLNKLPNNAFSLYNGPLSASVQSLMTKNLLHDYAEKIPQGSMQVSGLNLAGMQAAALSGLQLKLWLAWLATRAGAASLPSTHANMITEALFNSIPVEDVYHSLMALRPEEIKAMKASIIQVIVNKYPMVCRKFDGTIKYSDLTMTERCYRNISDATARGNALQAKDFEKTLFMHANSDQISGMQCSLKDRSESGLACTNMVSNKSKIISAMRYLGKSPDGKNPCEEVIPSELAYFSKEFPNAAAGISAQCLNAAERNFNDSDDSKVAENLKHLKDWTSRDDEYWTKMTAKTLGYLVAGGDFFYEVDEATVKKIPVEAFSALDSEAFIGYASRKLVFSKEQIAAMNDKVFIEVPSSLIDRDTMLKMRPPHFTHACLEAPEGENNLGAMLTGAILGELSTEQFGGITAKQWSVVASPNLSGINSAEKMGKVPAEATETWTLEGAKAIPTTSIPGMTVEQAKVIGLKATDKDAVVIYLFESGLAAQEANKILEGRLPENYEPSSSYLYLYIGLGIAAILVGAAGVVYWFFFRE